MAPRDFPFAEEEFEHFPSTPIPEILRCNLATAALQILAMGITNISAFDFLSKPDEKSIAAALQELTHLRAIQPSNDITYELTNDGRKMACFPLDPKWDFVVETRSSIFRLDSHGVC